MCIKGHATVTECVNGRWPNRKRQFPRTVTGISAYFDVSDANFDVSGAYRLHVILTVPIPRRRQRTRYRVRSRTLWPGKCRLVRSDFAVRPVDARAVSRTAFIRKLDGCSAARTRVVWSRDADVRSPDSTLFAQPRRQDGSAVPDPGLRLGARGRRNETGKQRTPRAVPNPHGGRSCSLTRRVRTKTTVGGHVVTAKSVFQLITMSLFVYVSG